MFVLHPVWDKRDLNTDAKRKRINFRFAELLKQYIEIKGDECILTRDSLDAERTSLDEFIKHNPASIVITIDCYADIDKSISGYDILCDAPSALVDTLNYEFYRCGRKSIRALGYNVTKSLVYGSIADITLYLGYVTNAEELAWLDNEANLEKLAKYIVEGAYSPPILTLENTDPAGNDDPYFYTFDTWSETPVSGASATFKDQMQKSLPIRYLSIDNTSTEPYLWSADTTYEAQVECFFICSFRAPAGKVTAYIKIGETEYETELSSYEFVTHVAEFSVNPKDKVSIGIKSTGKIDYAGIWVAPKGSLGSLDDPRTEYSIFPPGYRSVNKVSAAYQAAESVHMALTTANSLLTRGQDKTKITTNQVSNTDETADAANRNKEVSLADQASAASSAKKASSTITKVSDGVTKLLGTATTIAATALSTVAFANMFSGIVKNVGNTDKKKATGVNINEAIPNIANKAGTSTAPDPNAIKNLAGSMKGFESRGALLAASINVNSVGNASKLAAEAADSKATQLVDSFASDTRLGANILNAADGAITIPSKDNAFTSLSKDVQDKFAKNVKDSSNSISARAQQQFVVNKKQPNEKPLKADKKVHKDTPVLNVYRFISDTRTSDAFVKIEQVHPDTLAYYNSWIKEYNAKLKENASKLSQVDIDKIKSSKTYSESFTPESVVLSRLAKEDITAGVFYRKAKAGKYFLSLQVECDPTNAEQLSSSNPSIVVKNTAYNSEVDPAYLKNVILKWAGTITLPDGVAFNTSEGHAKRRLGTDVPYFGWGVPQEVIDELNQSNSPGVFALVDEAKRAASGANKMSGSTQEIGNAVGNVINPANKAIESAKSSAATATAAISTKQAQNIVQQSAATKV